MDTLIDRGDLTRMWRATRRASTVDEAYSRAYDTSRGGRHILEVDTSSAGYSEMCHIAGAMARLRLASDLLTSDRVREAAQPPVEMD